MSKILSLFVVAVLAIIAFCSLFVFGAAQENSKQVGTNYNFQLPVALRALKYAKIAYCHGTAIKNWDCPACPLHPNFKLKNVYVNASLESQAYSGYDPTQNSIVVTFRGSQNLVNWWTDFTFTKVTYPYCNGCEVHKGFWEEWQSFEVPMIQDVRALLAQYPSASIGVYGHSLGAAVAVHAVATFNRLKLASTITEYSFGTPRTGNTAFSEWVALVAKTSYGETQRVVNRADPVPHLPLISMGFLHSPHETWAKDAGTSPLIDCNDSPGHEDPDCSDSVIIPDFEDHVHYLGMHTECEMTESNKKLEVSPELKKKLYKLMRQDKIFQMEQRK